MYCTICFFWHISAIMHQGPMVFAGEFHHCTSKRRLKFQVPLPASDFTLPEQVSLADVSLGLLRNT